MPRSKFEGGGGGHVPPLSPGAEGGVTDRVLEGDGLAPFLPSCRGLLSGHLHPPPLSLVFDTHNAESVCACSCRCEFISTFAHPPKPSNVPSDHIQRDRWVAATVQWSGQSWWTFFCSKQPMQQSRCPVPSCPRVTKRGVGLGGVGGWLSP